MIKMEGGIQLFLYYYLTIIILTMYTGCNLNIKKRKKYKKKKKSLNNEIEVCIHLFTFFLNTFFLKLSLAVSCRSILYMLLSMYKLRP